MGVKKAIAYGAGIVGGTAGALLAASWLLDGHDEELVDIGPFAPTRIEKNITNDPVLGGTSSGLPPRGGGSIGGGDGPDPPDDDPKDGNKKDDGDEHYPTRLDEWKGVRKKIITQQGNFDTKEYMELLDRLGGFCLPGEEGMLYPIRPDHSEDMKHYREYGSVKARVVRRTDSLRTLSSES